MPPWDQDFDTYLVDLDEDPASFIVDLAAASHAPLAPLSTRVQVRVAMQAPRSDGLRAAAEAEALNALEDRIVELLAARIGAVFVGHAITSGMLHIACYADPEQIETPEKLLEGLDAGEYQVAWVVESDPEWDMYFEFLYPDVRTMQVIQNRRMMQLRAEHGDDPDIARVLDHVALFEARSAALDCAEALESAGFELDPIREQDGLWVLGFHREDRLGDENIDLLCFEILDLLEAHEGRYDGWGAPIVRAPLN